LHGLTQKLTLSAAFLALGVLFPILFHAVGLGSVFLPMYWPVAAAGFFLPLPFAVWVGVITPALSFLLTGMPPVSPPILQVMAPELAVLAFLTGLLYRKARMAIWPSVFVGLLASRFALFLGAGLLGKALGLPPRWASPAMLAKSLPGVLAILILVPPLVGRLLNRSCAKSLIKIEPKE
jgi:hypothetical protein